MVSIIYEVLNEVGYFVVQTEESALNRGRQAKVDMLMTKVDELEENAKSDEVRIFKTVNS